MLPETTLCVTRPFAGMKIPFCPLLAEVQPVTVLETPPKMPLSPFSRAVHREIELDPFTQIP